MEKSYDQIRDNKKRKAVELRAEGLSVEKIATNLSVSYRTVQRYWKQHDQDKLDDNYWKEHNPVDYALNHREEVKTSRN